MTGTFLQQTPTGGLSNAPQRVPRGFLTLDQARDVEDLIRTTLLLHLEQALDAPNPAASHSDPAGRPGQVASADCVCGAIVEAPLALAGKSVKCPGCSAVVALPPRESDVPAAADPGSCWEDGPIPADLKSKTLAGLDPNEKPVWIGQPVPKVILVRSIGYLVGGGFGILLALLWLVASLLPAKGPVTVLQGGKVVTVTPVSNPLSNPLIPLGIFFVSAAVASVALVRWHNARRTCYALTNRRALVYKEGLFGTTRESYTPLEVSNMRRGNSWLGGGSGDLIWA